MTPAGTAADVHDLWITGWISTCQTWKTQVDNGAQVCAGRLTTCIFSPQ